MRNAIMLAAFAIPAIFPIEVRADWATECKAAGGRAKIYAIYTLCCEKRFCLDAQCKTSKTSVLWCRQAQGTPSNIPKY